MDKLEYGRRKIEKGGSPSVVAVMVKELRWTFMTRTKKESPRKNRERRLERVMVRGTGE
jgi:hypothetical protein